METLENRITLLRKALNLNQTKFAQKLGLTQSTVSGWAIGKASITEQNIKLISLTFNVNELWLRTGEGEMFTTEDPDTDEFLKIYRALPTPFRKLFLEYGRLLIEQQAAISQSTAL
jgi:transcriptional regulator with XRE-family HTH domain